MYIIETYFLNSDDFHVSGKSYPCEDETVAKEVAKKIINGIVESLEETRTEEKINECIEALFDNKSVTIYGADCGYGRIVVNKVEPITNVDDFTPFIGSIY